MSEHEKTAKRIADAIRNRDDGMVIVDRQFEQLEHDIEDALAAAVAAERVDGAKELASALSGMGIDIRWPDDPCHPQTPSVRVKAGHVLCDDGTVRKVRGSLLLTDEGEVVGNGAKVWSTEDDVLQEVVVIAVDHSIETKDYAYRQGYPCGFSTKERAEEELAKQLQREQELQAIAKSAREQAAAESATSALAAAKEQP